MPFKYYPENERRIRSDMTAQEARNEFGDRLVAVDIKTDKVVACGDSDSQVVEELGKLQHETGICIEDLQLEPGSLHFLNGLEIDDQ